MRLLLALLLSAALLTPATDAPASSVWLELKTKRESLSSIHQDFEVSRTFKLANGTQSSKRELRLDVSHSLWRETSVTGSGSDVTIFDGQEVFLMEQGGNEYVRTKQKAKEGEPMPGPYNLGRPDWSKAIAIERRACGIPNIDHDCVVIQVPLKLSMTNFGNHLTTMVGGVERMLLDTETGLLISSHSLRSYDDGRGGYQLDMSYALKRMSYGAPADVNLFKLVPGGMSEVKELSRWNAAKIKKRFAGNAAPELTVTDLHGKPFSLGALKGKTVLLDFWTTWCGPCRADGPALEKLYRTYGEKDLMIVGISVSEDRGIVEKFLGEHPHSYPIVLTTENEIPRCYQIGVFPTYIVIDQDGKLVTAVEGDKGFPDLRKLLKKAGLETDNL